MRNFPKSPANNIYLYIEWDEDETYRYSYILHILFVYEKLSHVTLCVVLSIIIIWAEKLNRYIVKLTLSLSAIYMNAMFWMKILYTLSHVAAYVHAMCGILLILNELLSAYCMCQWCCWIIISTVCIQILNLTLYMYTADNHVFIAQCN